MILRQQWPRNVVFSWGGGADVGDTHDLQRRPGSRNTESGKESVDSVRGALLRLEEREAE